MACRIFGAKPLSQPMLGYCQLGSQEQTLVKFQSKYKNSIHENAFVCEMAAILLGAGENISDFAVSTVSANDLGHPKTEMQLKC